ncbi:SatD family protein [Papillibacter cinnamivorans]|uniref:SatD family (SatD) n=1 Tax=Papillibacter cinnamivorans DSM 12816 TaxID=1122930 RepID=A0A1W2C4P8_9FIRM|nr:SatD family protein [Papillibacter cinnamivorans]SMC79872.1 SatD family (SatD) [Papillibacter cinnamivorans DSM 12816]
MNSVQLFFPFRPYVAVIGDIRHSKQLSDRGAVQARLSAVLEEINRDCGPELASKFMITLGDEFQGLLKTGSKAVYILDTIERELYPVRLRFGIGVGEIVTDIRPELPLGADGPAYYNAREAIESLKTAEKKKMESKVNAKILIQGHEEVSELINAVFSLMTVVRETWTERRVEIINSYLKCGQTQEKAAHSLGIHQSNVQKALAASSFYTYRRALEAVSKLLGEIGEAGDV